MVIVSRVYNHFYLIQRNEADNIGQKINPCGLRIGVIKNWESRWYPDGADYLTHDNDEPIESKTTQKFKSVVKKINGIKKAIHMTTNRLAIPP